MKENRKIPEASMTLSTNQVHVWHAQLCPSNSQLLHLQTLLSFDEIKRARRFKTTSHQEAFISARGVLRLILSRYMGVAPDTLKFQLGPHGKPFLAFPTTPGYRFNVSHSQRHALYAVTLDREVGIDIEYHRRPLELHAARPTNLLSGRTDGFFHTSSNRTRAMLFRMLDEKRSIRQSHG